MLKDELSQQYFNKDYAQLLKSEKRVIDTQMVAFPEETFPEDENRPLCDIHPVHPDNR